MTDPGITLELFPAREGDCILVTCSGGDPAEKPTRILFDGGRAATYRDLRDTLCALPDDEREIDLLVVTHVDRDHIEGILKLLDDEECPVSFADVWFNGFHHLDEEEPFGAKQGEKLSRFLIDNDWPWNEAWDREAVVVGEAELPGFELGDVTLTVLSPDRRKLLDLHPKWLKECEDAGLIPLVPAAEPLPSDEESFGPIDVEALCAEAFEDDHTEANGSSIALLVEYAGRRVLMTGDAHVDRLVASLALLGATEADPLPLDVFKVAHHGSSHNISRELLSLVECPHYLVSTNGSYFQHPRRNAIARIAKFARGQKTVTFNYATEHTQPWDQAALRNRYRYDVVFGDAGYHRLTLPPL